MDILIADDDQVARLYLELALVSLHHSVTVAENGAEALELLGQFMFDAVLLDVEMPVIGGVETLVNIRANPALQELRVYALTAHTREPMLAAIRQAGFSGYLTKPYGPRELERLLSEKDHHT
jgi:two-component system, sensor histidine kinase and response regulator